MERMETLTAGQVAVELGVSKSTVYRWVANPGNPLRWDYVLGPRTKRIDRKTLNAYLEWSALGGAA